MAPSRGPTLLVEALHSWLSPDGFAPPEAATVPCTEAGSTSHLADFLFGTKVPTLHSHTAKLAHTGVAATSFTYAFPKAKLEPESMFSAKFRRHFHNYFLDKGMKFQVAYKSPLIRYTDLFDQVRFGCHDDLRDVKGLARKVKVAEKWMQCNVQGRCGKQWNVHPQIVFSTSLREISVKLQDLTSGDVRWDAIYSISGNTLDSTDQPIGGEHPFFQPDWCPASGDFIAHKYLLTVKNLDGAVRPGLDSVGEMHFTQYGPSQLANSYQWENNDDGEYAVYKPEDTCIASKSGLKSWGPTEPCGAHSLRSCTAASDLLKVDEPGTSDTTKKDTTQSSMQNGFAKLFSGTKAA